MATNNNPTIRDGTITITEIGKIRPDQLHIGDLSRKSDLVSKYPHFK